MNCRISELRDKQVICASNGMALGPVCDVEIDTCTGNICSLVIFGRCRGLGLFGREDDIIIPWCEIKVIGPDTVLVGMQPPQFNRPRGFWGKFKK